MLICGMSAVQPQKLIHPERLCLHELYTGSDLGAHRFLHLLDHVSTAWYIWQKQKLKMWNRTDSNKEKTVNPTKVLILISLDSKDLCTTQFTCRNAINRSIRGDAGVMRFEFETKKVSRMIRIPGNTNLSDLGTKINSPYPLSTTRAFLWNNILWL